MFADVAVLTCVNDFRVTSAEWPRREVRRRAAPWPEATRYHGKLGARARRPRTPSLECRWLKHPGTRERHRWRIVPLPLEHARQLHYFSASMLQAGLMPPST